MKCGAERAGAFGHSVFCAPREIATLTAVNRAIALNSELAEMMQIAQAKLGCAGGHDGKHHEFRRANGSGCGVGGPGALD